MEPYVARFRERQRQFQEEMEERRRLGREEARRIAGSLRERYGPLDIRLVGSLAKPDSRIYPGSDIDLLVGGLPEREYLLAGVLAERIVEGRFTVDIIRVEDAHPYLLAKFLDQGVVL